MTQRRGTLASIAAEVGVSRTTVSNAYNHPDQLSPELRERIFAVAQARGYTGPDPTARSLRTRQAGAVGVILTEHLGYAFEDQASIDFLAGLSESSAGAGKALTLIPLGPSQGAGISPLIGAALVDAFVVYSVPQSEPNLDAVLARGVPVVVCDQPYPVGSEGTAYVGIDDAEAIKPAARALVEAGHKRVGIVGKRLFRDESREGAVTPDEVAGADMHVQRGRIQGALEVFAEAGLADVPIVTRHFNDHDTAIDAARELFTLAPDLTAVLCTTDSMALGVLDYCESAGLRVPEDISVTGFDGVEQALSCGLSTVVQPNKRKGEAVGQVLTKLIDAAVAETPTPHDAPERVILPTEFRPGTTIAPPAAPPRAQ